MKRKNIIIIILILTIIVTIKYFNNALKEEENLAENSVYYAKNIPHAKDKHPVLIMLIDNLEYLEKNKPDNFIYDFDGYNLIKSNQNSNYFSNGHFQDNFYQYTDIKGTSYYFNDEFKLTTTINKNYNIIDVSTVDEQAIIDEIYEFVKPIVDSQTEPEVNLQEEFNKRYKDRFN